MASVSFFGTFEERRTRFWEECCRVASRYPNYDAQAVRDFFLFWTEPTPQGEMKWELERTFGISHRMTSYMKKRVWLESYWAARLTRAGGTQKNEQQRAMARAIEQERHEELQRSIERRQQNAVSYEEAMKSEAYRKAMDEALKNGVK